MNKWEITCNGKREAWYTNRTLAELHAKLLREGATRLEAASIMNRVERT